MDRDPGRAQAWKLNDWNTAVSIAGAFNNSNLSRLQHTWRAIETKEPEAMKAIHEIKGFVFEPKCLPKHIEKMEKMRSDEI